MFNLVIETRTDLFPFIFEGVIGYCGTEVVFSNYLMFVGSLDFQIIDPFPVYFGLKWSRSQVDWGKVWVVQVRESRWRSCCHILMAIPNSASFEGERRIPNLSFRYAPYILTTYHQFGEHNFFSYWLHLMHDTALEETKAQFFFPNFLDESFIA